MDVFQNIEEDLAHHNPEVSARQSGGLMALQYNSQRENLVLAEYGRNVQELIKHLLAIEDRAARTDAAHEVIKIMASINPQVKEQPEYQQKLWDHLHIISDFKLDVDAPYPLPESEVLSKKPDPMDYPQHKMRYRYYGKNIEGMVEAAVAMEDPELKSRLIDMLGSYMKMAYRQWNDDRVNDELIVKHMRALSGGRLEVKQFNTINKGKVQGPDNNASGQGGSNGKGDRRSRNRGKRKPHKNR